MLHLLAMSQNLNREPVPIFSTQKSVGKPIYSDVVQSTTGTVLHPCEQLKVYKKIWSWETSSTIMFIHVSYHMICGFWTVDGQLVSSFFRPYPDDATLRLRISSSSTRPSADVQRQLNGFRRSHFFSKLPSCFWSLSRIFGSENGEFPVKKLDLASYKWGYHEDRTRI